MAKATKKQRNPTTGSCATLLQLWGKTDQKTKNTAAQDVGVSSETNPLEFKENNFVEPCTSMNDFVCKSQNDIETDKSHGESLRQRVASNLTNRLTKGDNDDQNNSTSTSLCGGLTNLTEINAHLNFLPKPNESVTLLSKPSVEQQGEAESCVSISNPVPDCSGEKPNKTIVEGDYPLICFDLETTGLSLDDEIVQISACGLINGKVQEFNQYIFPNQKMAFGASKVTGLRIRRGTLYHNRARVETCSLLQGLNSFLHWLKKFPKSALVAHNAIFDSRMLVKGCVKHNLIEFGLKKAIWGFVDTLPAMKELYPDRSSYQLEKLVSDILDRRFKAHDAREDTRALLNLIQHKSVQRPLLLRHSFTVTWAEDNYTVCVQKKKNMKSLQDLVDSAAVSKGIAEKLAVSGLTKEELTSVAESRGLEGIKELCQADCNGKPRVTNRTAVMESLFNHLTIKD